MLVSGGAYYSIWKWQNKGLVTKESGLVPASQEEDQGKTVNASVVQIDNATDSEIQKALPDLARAALANFYVAYKDRDTERLSQLFTPNTKDEDKDTYDTLFKSTFSSEVATSYTVASVEAKGTGWTVKILEKRQDKDGKALASETATFMILTPGTENSSPWLVDSYQKAGIEGKYSGFLTN